MRTTSYGLLAAAGLLVAALPALAQAPAPAATYPRTEVVYYDAAGHPLPGEQGADHRAEIQYLDSLQTVERMFFPSGKLHTFGRFVHVRRGGQRYSVPYGRQLDYYESGQVHVQVDPATAQQAGQRLVRYPDGQLRRRDTLPEKGPTTGECFGPDGQPVAYYPYQQLPVYLEGDGGQAAIVAAIQRQLRYPAEALRHHLSGQVLVRFQVDRTGQVREPSIIGGIDERQFTGSTLAAVRQVEAAVLRAVGGLGAFQPGQFDGEPVPVSFSVPITFKLQ